MRAALLSLLTVEALRVGLERSNLKVTTLSVPEQESHAGVCSPRGKRTCIKFSSSHWRDAYSTLSIERGRCYGAG